MKKISTLMVLTMVLGLSPVWANKIAVYSAQKVVDGVNDGVKAKKKVQLQVDQLKVLQAQIKKKQEAFLKAGKEFESKQVTWPKEKAMIERNKLIAEQSSLQKLLVEAKEKDYKAQKMDYDLKVEFAGKMKNVIKKIAKTGSYDLILEELESGIHFTKSSMDITALVIKEYNKIYKK